MSLKGHFPTARYSQEAKLPNEEIQIAPLTPLATLITPALRKDQRPASTLPSPMSPAKELRAARLGIYSSVDHQATGKEEAGEPDRARGRQAFPEHAVHGYFWMFVFGDNQGDLHWPDTDAIQIPPVSVTPVIGSLSSNTVAVSPATTTLIIRHLQNP